MIVDTEVTLDPPDYAAMACLNCECRFEIRVVEGRLDPADSGRCPECGSAETIGVAP